MEVSRFYSLKIPLLVVNYELFFFPQRKSYTKVKLRMKKNLELFEEMMLWAAPVGLLNTFTMKQEWKVLDSHTVLSRILAFSVANMRTRIRILSRFFNQTKIWHELRLLPSPAPYRIHRFWWKNIISRYVVSKIVKVDHGSPFDKDYAHRPLKRYIEYQLCAWHNRNWAGLVTQFVCKNEK